MDHEFKYICQGHLPISPWDDQRLKRLPGINPLDRGDWIVVDDVFTAQMAYADHLLQTRRAAVLAIDDCAMDAAHELLEHVLAAISMRDDYAVNDGDVTRPDGVTITLDWDNALETARRLVQQDLCLMMPVGDEHVLVGGAMCFPASWTLSEKFMRPMTAIHEPVAAFGADMANRVERMFRMMRPGQDLWRANWLIYNDPDLHQPRPNGVARSRERVAEQWMRVERQSLRKLPRTGVVVFGIHTAVVGFDQLTTAQAQSLHGVIATAPV